MEAKECQEGKVDKEIFHIGEIVNIIVKLNKGKLLFKIRLNKFESKTKNIFIPYFTQNKSVFCYGKNDCMSAFFLYEIKKNMKSNFFKRKEFFVKFLRHEVERKKAK